jgi:hypothetical protein
MSTGPRTPEGKAISRYNGLWHGLRAVETLLPDESPEEHQALVSAIWEQYRPETPVEAVLVERIASQVWRLSRVARIEAGVLTWQLLTEHARVHDGETDGAEFLARLLRQEPDSTAEAALEASRKGAPALGRAFSRDASGPDALSKLSRYEMRISRNLTRDILLLERLQAARRP